MWTLLNISVQFIESLWFYKSVEKLGNKGRSIINLGLATCSPFCRGPNSGRWLSSNGKLCWKCRHGSTTVSCGAKQPRIYSSSVLCREKYILQPQCRHHSLRWRDLPRYIVQFLKYNEKRAVGRIAVSLDESPARRTSWNLKSATGPVIWAGLYMIRHSWKETVELVT